MHLNIPQLKTNIKYIDRAFRIAMGDLMGNILPFSDGLLTEPKEAILAGLDYYKPWTRDAAINVWNGAGLLVPEAAKNTLLSVLTMRENQVTIGGQYWDAIIWVPGAWSYYLYTGDKEFLSLAVQATQNSLKFFEDTEFDPSLNLFRGAACYGDGISAYPDAYTKTTGTACILDWPGANPDLVAEKGVGIPMHALSTNCLYYQAYTLVGKMEEESGLPNGADWEAKAERLKEAINHHFWIEDQSRYRYLVDPIGNCDHQEGLGHSFALLFGIADEVQGEKVFKNQHITPAGIPCVWPTFKRYESEDGMSFGRHCGTVWPHIQTIWADTAAHYGKEDLFAFELHTLAKHACRDTHFAEVYHPVTGEMYGGEQEYVKWKSCSRQTWCATGYISMIMKSLVGMEFSPQGITFKPLLPAGFEKVELRNISYRNITMDVLIYGQGSKISEFTINGGKAPTFIPSTAEGYQKVIVKVEK